MRILMFGWEFPPHISGGLGTACFGLTQALVSADAQILFVIPKADAQTTGEGVNIIGASTIGLPGRRKITGRPEPRLKSTIRQTVTKAVITIPIRSGLSPYTTIDSSQALGLSQWNYQVPVSTDVHVQGEKTKEVRYPFSGTYGPRLLEEVERYAEVAAEIAKQNSFDIIHAHDWLAYDAGISAKRISGKPLVVHVHATEYDRAGENVDPRIYEIERRGMEAADRVIAVSQWTKDIVTSHYGIPEEKIQVIHNGIADKTDRGFFSRPPIRKKVVTFLGRITYQKGPCYFIEAARKVLQHVPDVHFVMAGSGDMLVKMIERVAELKMSSHFHFTGFLKGDLVDKIWSVSTIYVMPSVSEPFGIAPLEAMQAGVPVIISKQSGVAEVVDHAVKVDFWDTEALANAICNILKYKSLKNTLRSKSTQALQQITWNRAARQIIKLYHELTTKTTVLESVFSGAPA